LLGDFNKKRKKQDQEADLEKAKMKKEKKLEVKLMYCKLIKNTVHHITNF
jgi:hypothetical protein